MDREQLVTNSSPPTAPTAAPAVLTRCRRWYQFSLRTLIVAVVVVSVGLGLFAARLQRARRQAAAVARIEKAGGSVGYDFEARQSTDGDWVWVEARSPIPSVILQCLGRDFFHDVIAAYLAASLLDVSEPSAADVRKAVRAVADLPKLEEFVLVPGRPLKLDRSELQAIAQCQRLRNLTLWDAVGDSELRHLESLPRLEALALGDSSATDAALKAVARLRGLRRLDLDYARITDRGLNELRTLTNLEHLRLNGTPVTGTGVDWPPSLKVANLSGSSLSDAGLATLVRCRQLERLDLRDTHVTNGGLAHLTSLSKLQQLYLDRAPITDDGLVHLGKLPSLRELSLSRVKISSDGAKHLKNLQSLESLDLSGTFVDGEFDWPASLLQVDLDDSCITDKGLQRLAECPKLRRASLGGRNLATADGEKAFREARPDVDTTGF